MQKRIFVVIAALSVIVAVAIFAAYKGSEKAKVTPKVQNGEQAADDSAFMQPGTTVAIWTQDSSLIQNGRFVIKEIEGKTWLNVNMPVGEEEPGNKPYHAALRGGKCNNPSSEKYVLENLWTGSSETFLPMSLEQFKKQLPMNVVVQMPEPDITIVACGDITTVY